MQGEKCKYYSLPLLSTIVALASYVSQIPTVIILGTLILGIVSLFDICINKTVPSYFAYSFVVLCSVNFIGMFKFAQYEVKFFYFFLEIIVFYLSWAATRKLQPFYFSIRLVFWLFFLFSFSGLILYRDEVEPLGKIINGSSQNGITSYMIVLLICYLISSLVTIKKLPILPILATMFISFFGVGRGSIVVCILIFFVYILHFSLKERGVFKWFIIIISVLVGMVTLNEIIDYLISGTKLSVGFKDSHRINIFNSYINSLDVFSVIFGGGYEQTLIDTKYSGNPHIAFIRLHSMFGILSLVVIFTPLLYLTKGFTLENITICLLSFMFLVRAISEPMLFPGLLDFFFYSSFFVFFSKCLYINTK